MTKANVKKSKQTSNHVDKALKTRSMTRINSNSKTKVKALSKGNDKPKLTQKLKTTKTIVKVANLTKKNIKMHCEQSKESETRGNQYWRYSKKSKWSGNSDTKGSVDSGLLDENICYECGISTKNLSLEDWNQFILCDRCDAEYHLTCLNLDKVPRISFTCPRCQQAYVEFNHLKYVVNINDLPVVSRRKLKNPPSYCYSPSRPVSEAWNELIEKGLMCVSKVFSHSVMK